MGERPPPEPEPSWVSVYPLQRGRPPQRPQSFDRRRMTWRRRRRKELADVSRVCATWPAERLEGDNIWAMCPMCAPPWKAETAMRRKVLKSLVAGASYSKAPTFPPVLIKLAG